MFSMLAASLTEQLRSLLSWKNSRVETLGILVLSILRNRTVNLVKLSTETPPGLKSQSLYRRFQNFFLRFDMPLEEVGGFALSKIPKPRTGWVLSMDRTNWQYGKTHINLLVIAVVINKVAIPVAWRTLPQTTKRGNSRSEHRIDLMKRLLRIMPAADISVLTMDREFSGKRWLRWLEGHGVGYILRVKHNTCVGGSRAGERRHRSQLRSSARREAFGFELFFAGCAITGKNTRDDFLYLVSNRFHGKEALDLYRLRWGIEQVFSHFKKRGFDLESTHMSDPRKIEKLFAVLTLAFLVSYGWGCEMKEKTNLSAPEKRKSIFRLGLDRIGQLFADRNQFENEIRELWRWFGEPKFKSIFVV